MKEEIQNLELIHQVLQRVVDKHGIFILENPFILALLEETIVNLKKYDEQEITREN